MYRAMNRIVSLSLACAALTACGGERDGSEDPVVAPSPTPTPSPSGTSILRPDVETELGVEPELEPLELRLTFDQNTRGLDDRMRARLDEIIASDQAQEADWPIRIGGHTDSGGSDDANMRASLARAEAVRDYMVEQGIAEDRITVTAFGEQNPIRPNARPDGSPNEDGRAQNRRVEIAIAPPETAAEEAAPPAEASAAEAFSAN